MNRSYEHQLKNGLKEALAAMRPNYMATINYRKPLSGGREARRRTVLKNYREWNRQVLEKLFGRKFAKRNAADAFLSVAFIEIGPLLFKEHMHILIRVPDELRAKFESSAAQAWQPTESAPAVGAAPRPLESDILIKRIHDLEGAVRYCTKDVRANGDSVVFSNESRISKS